MHLRYNRRMHRLGSAFAPEKMWFSPDDAWLLVESKTVQQPFRSELPEKEWPLRPYREIEAWRLGERPRVTRFKVWGASYKVTYQPGGPSVEPDDVPVEPPAIKSCFDETSDRPKPDSRAVSPDGQVQALLFSPKMVRGVRPKADNNLQIFDSSCRLLYALSADVGSLRFSPSGRWLLAEDWDKMSIHDLSARTLYATEATDSLTVPQLGHITFSPGDNYMAAAHGFAYYTTNKDRPVLSVYDRASGKRVASMY